MSQLESNLHPIPGFVCDISDVDVELRTYRSKVVPPLQELMLPESGVWAGHLLGAQLDEALVDEAVDVGVGDGFVTVIQQTSDKIQIAITDTDVHFEVLPSPTAAALGFSATDPVSSGVIIIPGVGTTRGVTAPNDWVRGALLIDDFRIRVTQDGSGAVDKTLVVGNIGWISSILQWIAPTSASWADEDWRFGLTNDGHLFYSTKESPVPAHGSGRAFLGFNSLTNVAHEKGWQTYFAAYPCPGVWVPTRPLARRLQRTDNDTSSVKLLSGRRVFHHRGSYTNYELEAWVDGPADSVDLYKHVLDRFAPFCHPGSRVDYHARWGDPRASRQDWDVTVLTRFSRLHNNYNNGELGLVKCYASEEMADYIIDWPEDLRRRSPLTLSLEYAHDLD